MVRPFFMRLLSKYLRIIAALCYNDTRQTYVNTL